MIKTRPAQGPSIFVSADSRPDLLEVYLHGKSYTKFLDMCAGTLGTRYVFADRDLNVDAIAVTYLQAQLTTLQLQQAHAETLQQIHKDSE